MKHTKLSTKNIVHGSVILSTEIELFKVPRHNFTVKAKAVDKLFKNPRCMDKCDGIV